jgi:hypothetical protein
VSFSRVSYSEPNIDQNKRLRYFEAKRANKSPIDRDSIYDRKKMFLQLLTVSDP